MTEDMVDDGARGPVAPFISRVRIKNYKSIAECDVRLGALTVLVGPNGAGKSNFLDALAFLSRALETTPAEALNEHGGLRQVLRQVPEQARSFTIGVEASLPWWPALSKLRATYEFEIGPSLSHASGFAVIREDCTIRDLEGTKGTTKGFTRSIIVADNQAPDTAALEADRLTLPILGAQESFAQLYTGLSRPRFYNFTTEIMRRPQRRSARAVLQRDGEGLGDVLTELSVQHPDVKSRIDAYIGAIARGATSIESNAVGGYTAMTLQTEVEGKHFRFESTSMSDGTIRAVAVLAALFQPESLNGRLPLIGIEEPEAALHPAAAGALFDALTEASDHVQVIATSQSADLLDREDLDVSSIRPVAMRDGLTIIGEVDDASREIAKEKLFTLGELMRSNQLSPQVSGIGF